MSTIRLAALGLIGLWIARELKQSDTAASPSLAGQPDHLLPARTKSPQGPRQGRVASADTHIPEYTATSSEKVQRQPENTPANQKLGVTSKGR